MNKKHLATSEKITMQLTIDVPEKLIDDIMANFPEYSSLSLRCIGWDYKKCEFDFWDCEVTPDSAEESIVKFKKSKVETYRGTFENQVVYELTRTRLERGFKLLMAEVMNGKLPGLSVSSSNFLDPGQWDSDCADALVQCAIFGKVIYG